MFGKKVVESIGENKVMPSQGFYIVVNDGGDVKVYGRNKFGYSTEDEALRDMAEKIRGFALVVPAKDKHTAKKIGEDRFYNNNFSKGW